MEKLEHTPGPRARIETHIRNQFGLHPRLACALVRCASRFQSKLTLHVGGRRYSARRVTEVLEANLSEGTALCIEAQGPDCATAAAAIDTFLRHLALVEDRNRDQRKDLSLLRYDSLCD